MNCIQRCLAGLGGILLTLAAAPPAALAMPPPPEPAPLVPVTVHTVATGGMPGWQITLIAAGPRSWPPRWRCSSTGRGQHGSMRPNRRGPRDRPPRRRKPDVP